MTRRLNLGAGGKWQRDGWEVLDHAKTMLKRAQAWDMPFADETFDILFSSNMIEHISHFKIEETLAEINRVVKVGGIVRLQTPDLRVMAEAYVNNDVEAMRRFQHRGDQRVFKKEFNLGLGHDLMNFLVSNGLDNFMFSNDFSEAYPGYAHVFCYDFELLSGLLEYYGFTDIRKTTSGDSEIEDVKELRTVPYDIDAEHMLNVECRKARHVPVDRSNRLMQAGPYDLDSTRPSRVICFLAHSYWLISNNPVFRSIYSGLRKLLPGRV